MARIAQLEPDIYVAWQLVESDFADLAARGFRSVVNNRPDGEAPEQLPNARAQAALLQKNPQPTQDEIEYALDGNICRCAGYPKIFEAVREAGKIMKNKEVMPSGGRVIASEAKPS